MDCREKHLSVPFRLYDVNFICPCLHHVLQYAKTFFTFVCIDIHSDQIPDIILILFQFNCILPGDKQTLSLIFFNVIDIIDPFKFHDHKLLKKTD